MSKYSKGGLLEKAVEITIAYGKGSSTTYPDLILRKAYDELKKINDELDEE